MLADGRPGRERRKKERKKEMGAKEETLRNEFDIE